jgi:IMP dehydrogenase
LTARDLRFVETAGTVADRMTPRDRLIVREGVPDAATAEEVMRVHKIKKLPLVDEDSRLIGLVTSADLLKQERLPFATRDDHGRLRVGAAIGAKGDYLERAAELIRVGADVIVIDIAHGHSAVMGHGDRGVSQAVRRRRAHRRERRRPPKARASSSTAG